MNIVNNIPMPTTVRFANNFLVYSVPTPSVIPYFITEEQRRFYDKANLCFEAWKKKLNMQLYLRLHAPLRENVFGTYNSLWRRFNINNDKFGEICINVLKHKTEQDLYDTIKHEIAHAVCDLIYNDNCGHGSTWIKVAKIMNVKTTNYIH